MSVHPRACGEYSHDFFLLRADAGSSPRMRGIPKQGQAVASVPRFIPAHAGNTTKEVEGEVYSPVHPRACGEYDDDREANIYAAGSSPRMRGILGKMSIL